MIKDFLSSSEVHIRLLMLSFILINDSLAQILPSSFGVHHKKLSSASDESCSMCDYSIEVVGASSVSNSDNITFSSVAIKDGFYSIGSTDTNL